MSDTIHETSSQYSGDVALLYSGDLLEADEFFCRYERADEKIWAERINGRVYLMPALRAVEHGGPHSLLNGWLFNYAMMHPQLRVYDNASIRLDTQNDPQPDLCLRKTEGTSRLVDGYIHGPPELIVEVAGSSASYDFGEKKDAYEAAGVSEYLIFETFEGQIAWWRLEQGRFVPIGALEGVYRSHFFPGLWLDADALRRGDARTLIDTLRVGMEQSTSE